MWFIKIDKERLKAWPVDDTLGRFQELEDEIREVLPESRVTTGSLEGVITRLERRRLFAGIPVLLLLAVMGVTVLFYMSMMVSYLVQSRQRDAALLRSRGVGTTQLLRLYLVEGLGLTVVAVALATVVALGIVASAGKLPYFREMTGGGFMPVAVGPAPLLVAVGAGLICLMILVVPGALSVRSGLLFQKLQAARPPSTSWFHRYYLDAAILMFGGLIPLGAAL